MTRQNDVENRRDPNLIASLVQSATTVAGIAVALDATLYVLNAQRSTNLVPSYVIIVIAAAAGMCIASSIGLMVELIRTHDEPIRTAFVHWDYALMVTVNFLLLGVLALLHWPT